MRRKFSIKQSLRQAEKDALLARPDGFTADGQIAGDYLEAGRDPKLPRQSAAHIAKAINKRGAPPCPSCGYIVGHGRGCEVRRG